MTFSTLQWVGPELAREGLLRNENWVVDHSAEAVALFPNQGLHAAATLMAAMHPHALDYIRQAPVLVVAASYGRSLHKQKERLFVARNWGSACHRGPKLRDMMADFRVAYQLRTLDGFALCPTRWPTLQKLSKIAPSTLAQIIPAAAGPQARWLRSLGAWLTLSTRHRDHDQSLFEWVARETGTSALPFDPTVIRDYIEAHPGRFNPAWSLKRALEVAETWHAELAKRRDEEEFFRTHHIGFADRIDYRPLPNDPVTVGDFEIVPLRSGEELFLEGAAMHHCVSSYSLAVVKGRSRVFSVRRDGHRIATAELGWRDRAVELVQLKGPCNAAPIAGVRRTVNIFIEQMSA